MKSGCRMAPSEDTAHENAKKLEEVQRSQTAGGAWLVVMLEERMVARPGKAF